MQWHMGLILKRNIGKDTRLYKRNYININIIVAIYINVILMGM